MKVEDFFNQAFLAALSRLPAAEAKAEAETATQLCIDYWQRKHLHWAPLALLRWQDQDVAHVPKRHEASTEAIGDRAASEPNSA